MSFGDALRRISNNLEDGLGVALVGMDGIIVEEHRKDLRLDLAPIAAEACSILRGIEKLCSNLAFGAPLELSVTMEGAVLMLRRVNPDYFAVLLVRSEGNLGKGRYLLRREATALEKELR